MVVMVVVVHLGVYVCFFLLLEQISGDMMDDGAFGHRIFCLKLVVLLRQLQN